MIAILVAVAGYNLAPWIGALMQNNAAETDGGTTIEFTHYLTTDLTIPTQIRGGACAERSQFISRTDAVRCTVGVSIYDPCFVVPAAVNEPSTVVCGVDAGSGADSFAVAPKLDPTPAPPTQPTINQGDLGWLSYPLDMVNGNVRLVNDQYYFPTVEGMEGSLLVALSKMRAHGDLDGDGDEDVAVLLVADADDDRMYIYLAAVLNQNGNAVPAGSILLGDRVSVDQMSIRNGQIIVNLTTHTSDDPACCPTLDVAWRYNLQGNRLVQAIDAWRIELNGGVQCVPVQAAAQQNQEGGALPFVYQCNNGTWMRNGLYPGETWYAQYAGDLDANGNPRFAPISRLWQ